MAFTNKSIFKLADFFAGIRREDLSQTGQSFESVTQAGEREC